MLTASIIDFLPAAGTAGIWEAGDVASFFGHLRSPIPPRVVPRAAASAYAWSRCLLVSVGLQDPPRCGPKSVLNESNCCEWSMCGAFVPLRIGLCPRRPDPIERPGAVPEPADQTLHRLQGPDL